MVAVHLGPYRTIQPIEHHANPGQIIYIVEGAAKRERQKKLLPFYDLNAMLSNSGTIEKFLENLNITDILRSSSEDVEDPDIETMIAHSANNLSIPVHVVEDFPGNYKARECADIHQLFVEDEYTSQLHRGRGVSNTIRITPNPRYQFVSQIDKKAHIKNANDKLGKLDLSLIHI